jgi:phosphoribosylformylglycinamidine synthase
MLAVAEAARNLSCSGALPKGVTDCLNFANPEKPEAFWQFRRAVEGLAAACEAFETPVVSGNVSFYNETPESAVYPTPTVGMVGVLDDVEKRCASAFQREGDVIYLLGPAAPSPDEPLDGIGGSEYLSLLHGLEVGKPPRLDLQAERNLHSTLRSLISAGWLQSAHDCSDGGLAVALVESGLLGGRGAQIQLPETGDDPVLATAVSPVWQLFSEAQSRVIVSVSTENAKEVEQRARELGVSCARLGRVGGDRFVITGRRHAGNADPETLVELSLREASALWNEAIPNSMQ